MFEEFDFSKIKLETVEILYAGILSGVMYMMNKFTSNLNKWEDFTNGY